MCVLYVSRTSIFRVSHIRAGSLPHVLTHWPHSILFVLNVLHLSFNLAEVRPYTLFPEWQRLTYSPAVMQTFGIGGSRVFMSFIPSLTDPYDTVILSACDSSTNIPPPTFLG